MGWLGDIGGATLGLATSGLYGNEKMGFMDDLVDGSLGRKTGNLWKDVTGVTAAEGAAEAQRAGLDAATASQERMFDKSMATQAPWLEAGQRGLGELEAGIGSGRFDMDQGDFQFDFEADPGYQFRLQQGTQARENSAAARGWLFSGATGRRLEEYGQNLASQEYGNAYNRARGEYQDDFNRERTTKMDDYNRLASMSGVGQMTAGNVGQQQMAQGGNLANLDLQGGNIGAQRSMAGYQGGMNLLNTGLQAVGTVSGMMSGGGAPKPKAPLYGPGY